MDKIPARRPSWLKVSPFSGDRYQQIRRRLRGLTLHTVCEEANCPNRGECFNSGTATFLLMGPLCSRNCRFCNVSAGQLLPPDPDEPEKVATVASELELSHVVVTSVTRDDLPDEGAGQFRNTVNELKKALPRATIELLTPDFHGRKELLDLVLQSPSIPTCQTPGRLPLFSGRSRLRFCPLPENKNKIGNYGGIG
jgi:lipoic acid synthetase